MRIKQVIALALVTVIVAVVNGCSTSSATGPQIPERYITSNSPAAKIFAEAADIADQFIIDQFDDIKPVGGYVLIRHGAVIWSPECGTHVDDDGFYCGGNESVYFGEALLRFIYEHYGAIAIYMFVGHEVGHHIDHARHGAATKEDFAGSQLDEIQSDCYGGAFAKYAAAHRDLGNPLDFRLDLLLRDVVRAFNWVENDPTDEHAPPEARQIQYYVGALNGSFICDAY